MDNPETLTTLDTHDTGQRQTKQKKISTTNSINKPWVNPDALEGSAVPASYKTHTVLLIFTVNSG